MKTYRDTLNRKQKRYYDRIDSMLKENVFFCYFITLTFNDKSLQKTTDKTRLRYVKEFLNKQAKNYVANIDYGEKNEREHYHAFILSRYKVILTKEWKHGAIQFRKPHHTIGQILSAEPLPTAENLTRHAFKDTTRQAKIIYSRESKPKKAITIKANKKLKEYNQTDKAQQIKRFYGIKDRKTRNLLEAIEKLSD